MKWKIPRWSPAVLMILIFIESSIPMDGGSGNIQFLTNIPPTIQNLLHIPLYGTLAFLWLNFFCSSGKFTKQTLFYCLTITIGFGCLDEVHQSFIEERYAGLWDVYLNIIGAAMGTIIFGYFRKNQT